MKRTLIVLGVVAVALVVWKMQDRGPKVPSFDPAAFDGGAVDNPYFSLTPGARFVYEAEKPEGKERIEVTVLRDTKTILGISATVVKDQVFLNGSLIEDTLDWYAQDRDGNVWYLGEQTAEYENGKMTTTAGSWEAGINGARPGYAMPAAPRSGFSYHQEYAKGEAEDAARVLSLGEEVSVPSGAFNDCIRTYDFSTLDPKAQEHKYYCRGAGFLALEVNLEDNERTELVLVTRPGAAPAPSVAPSVIPSAAAPSRTPSPKPSSSASAAPTGEEQAKAVALARVPGTVTDIALETRAGKQVYVVEIQPSGGGAETDVVVDAATGAVIAVE